MTCRTACTTKDHASFGDCMRSANVHIGYCGIGGNDFTAQKKWDAELQSYRDARRQGVQPAGTTTRKIREAMEISERTGRPYDASAPNAGVDIHAFE